MTVTRIAGSLLVLIIGGTTAASAQEPPVTPPPAAAPVVQSVAPAAAALPVNPVSIERRREQIDAMEGLLTAAVRSGAQATARQIQQVQPGLMLFTGTARARGFVLDGYGLFFHVEIPGVRPSVAQLVEQIERDRSGRLPNGRADRAVSGSVMVDPNAAYTEAVQQKLVEAMLDFRLDLQPSEWLTVAARDADGPLAPGEIYESVTIVIRVKGSDLSDFHAGRISREDIRKRFEVRGF
jgi:hypothetical protein